MMQPADMGDGDYLTFLRRLDLSRNRGIPLKRQVCPGTVVVFDAFGEDAPEAVLAEHLHVVETFPPDGADDALR